MYIFKTLYSFDPCDTAAPLTLRIAGDARELSTLGIPLNFSRKCTWCKAGRGEDFYKITVFSIRSSFYDFFITFSKFIPLYVTDS